MGSSCAFREALGLNLEVKQRLCVRFGHSVALGGGLPMYCGALCALSEAGTSKNEKN